MPLVVKDRVRETTASSGTGPMVLAGPVLGYQAFSVIGDTNTVYYCIAGQLTSEWEVGLGTYTAATNSLARTSVFASSNGGAAVSFSAGVKDIFAVAPPADRFVDNQGNFATGTWGINISGNAATATSATSATNATNATNAINATNLFGGLLYNTEEIATLPASPLSGTINYDLITQSVIFTNVSSNWTINFRGDGSTTLNSILPVGRSMTAVFMAINQVSPVYYNTAIQVDGTAGGVAPRWQGGSAPTSGNSNSVDVYTYSIIKTSAAPTYAVFASQTRFA